jgi:4-amino-4-deoxy-L-arabinose transferase-like glycosyltransferase
MTPSVARVVWLMALTALGRVALAASLGLSVDESYTVAISRHFAASYFDHPPLHVWLVGLWARLTGSERPLVLRLPDIALFAASTWLVFRITARAYGERAGMWAAVAFNLAPLFTFNAAGGILPDGPLVLFSLLAVLCFMRALPGADASRADLRWMLAAGCASGLALLSKYTALFTVISLGLYVLSARPRLLATRAPWLAALVMVILLVPVLAWNSAHDWVSFAFQGGRARPVAFSITRALLDFAGQLCYVLPWVALALLAALWHALRSGPRDSAGWLFACLAVVPIGVFTLVGLLAPALPHWAALGWLFAFPLLGTRLARLEERRPRLPPRLAAISGACVVLLAVLWASQAEAGWIERLAPDFAPHDPTIDQIDWQALKPLVLQLRRRNPKLVVAAVSWIDAGKADYALGGAVPVLCLSADAREFGVQRPLRSYRGHDALIVAAAGRADWLKLAAPYFARLTPAADIGLMRAGRPALTLHTALGFDLRSGGERAADAAIEPEDHPQEGDRSEPLRRARE